MYRRKLKSGVRNSAPPTEEYSARRYIADCAGKEGFAQHSLAARAAERMRLRGRAACPFHCPHCKKWHVGVRSKGMARGKSERWRDPHA